MSATREEMKAEAVKRLKLWGLSTYSLRAFIERDKVVQTDNPGGCCYDLEPYKIERIKRYEKRHKVLVYHVLNQVKPGVVHREVWLYVSDNPKTWPEDIADLEKGFQTCYKYNSDFPRRSDTRHCNIVLTGAAGLAESRVPRPQANAALKELLYPDGIDADLEEIIANDNL